ncbi:hypothetical protein K435DRAFT_910114 [Dendrothele bispora CBS 962.96]|uniref:Uncharacterized protein n=1 Tax=Dendrothele bispora (strain CBS 962.96) TaxID=1314807 RepID=A0A4S8LP27_DENBC|nr:hypothetical protein K435DRAFT_910114 [Dendrothele bispora CBS 962.96]
MMEQLAERRMQREDDAVASLEDGSEDEDDDEDGEDGEDDLDDEDENEDDDDDEEEVLTEEQKMEEGKNIFSIFAARMFEQRVLQAYREKVAQERQMQLLRELEDEEKMSKERVNKKASQNQKKKDKKRWVHLSLFPFLCSFFIPSAMFFFRFSFLLGTSGCLFSFWFLGNFCLSLYYSFSPFRFFFFALSQFGLVQRWQKKKVEIDGTG